MIFLKELINVLRRGRLHIESRYKSKKVDNFSLSQKIHREIIFGGSGCPGWI